jgi:hypothetical protein
MKTTFSRSSSLPERSSGPGTAASADSRMTALLFVGLLVASFYGESLRWNDRQAAVLRKTLEQPSAAAVSPAKTVATQKAPAGVITGC